MDIEKQLEKILIAVTSKDEHLSAMLSPSIVSCDVNKGETHTLFQMKDWEKNQRGEIHGGAIAAMFDTAMGCTAAAFHETGTVTTTDLHVSYIRPFIEREYLFISQVIHAGRTLVRMEAKAVARDSGKIAASCAATFCPYRGR